jgi:hypothetical protein
MMGPQKRRGPGSVGALPEAENQNHRIGNSSALAGYRALAGSRPAVRSPSRSETRAPRLPDNWRERLPDPAVYYAEHVDNLARSAGDGWAACRCPFHDDAHASAAANLIHGGFRCHAGQCEVRGDLVAFHMRRTGLAFASAVRDLIGGRR